MKVRRYHLDDFKEVAEWGKGWGFTYEPDLFPKVGFIVPGVAAYFLYATDSAVCYLEHMVSNPKTFGRERDLALKMVVEAILEEAAKRGYRVAYACTDIGKVVERAILSGAQFKPNYVLLTKYLRPTDHSAAPTQPTP